MIDEKRVGMMTKLTDFEKHNSKPIETARCYYRGDYIGISLFKNLLRITVAYLIGAGLWACCSMEEILARLNTMDIKNLAVRLAITYGITVFLFLGLTYVTSTVRFYLAEKKFQTYKNMLSRLEKESGHRDTKTRRRNRGGTTDDDIFQI